MPSDPSTPEDSQKEEYEKFLREFIGIFDLGSFYKNLKTHEVEDRHIKCFHHIYMTIQDHGVTLAIFDAITYFTKPFLAQIDQDKLQGAFDKCLEIGVEELNKKEQETSALSRADSLKAKLFAINWQTKHIGKDSIKKVKWDFEALTPKEVKELNDKVQLIESDYK